MNATSPTENTPASSASPAPRSPRRGPVNTSQAKSGLTARSSRTAPISALCSATGVEPERLDAQQDRTNPFTGGEVESTGRDPRREHAPAHDVATVDQHRR